VTHPVVPGEHCFPVREKPSSGSKVLAYVDEVWLKDAVFFVQPGGLRRIQSTGTRSPIAFVYGTALKSPPRGASKKSGWFDVRFEPFEHGCFFDARNAACLTSAKYVHLGKRKIRALGSEQGDSVTSLRQLNPAVPLITPRREKWIGDMGGLNYASPTSTALRDAKRYVFERYPGAVILDGTDDWDAPEAYRPSAFLPRLGVRPLAWWHTGQSGALPTGAVVSDDDLPRLRRAYREVYGVDLGQVAVTRPQAEPGCGCWDGSAVRVISEP